jgi:hypothetical protein
MRGITKEIDKEIQGKINRRKKLLPLVWAILCLGVGIFIFFSPQSSIQKKGGDIQNALAIIYNENSEKRNVTGTLVKRDRDVGYVLTVAGVCIKREVGSEIKLWLPGIGSKWLPGRILKIYKVMEKASDHRLSPDIALIEIQLRGIKNQPVPIYNSEESEQVKRIQAEVWKIDFQTGRVEPYTLGTISAFSTQRTYLVLKADFQEHIDGAPVVLKSKEKKYVLLGILPELLPKISNPSRYDGGKVDMEETFSFVEIGKLMNEVIR